MYTLDLSADLPTISTHSLDHHIFKIYRSKNREYRELPDMLSTDDEAYRIRKQLTPVFYDVYYKVFMRAMQEEGQITPILEMFLNFGFMDVQKPP